MFITQSILDSCGWQAFERMVARLLLARGFSGVRVVGGSGDKGADILAIGKDGSRWLIQAKYWGKQVPEAELRKTVEAMRAYRASICVIAALHGVDEQARRFQLSAQLQGVNISVWTSANLISMASQLNPEPLARKAQGEYQEAAICSVVDMLTARSPNRGMVVMATGLGKTFTASEAIRRVRAQRDLKVLVLAHTNQLVLQLERAFWPSLRADQATAVWNQHERQTQNSLLSYPIVFASRDSVANFLDSGGTLPAYDLILVDECHHANEQSSAYQKIFSETRAGKPGGPQLLGLSATPFLVSPEAKLDSVFGHPPLVSVDMVFGLSRGFLSKVDYRLYTDNINWDGLKDIQGKPLSPRSINRHFFIKEWDEGVVSQLQLTWSEVPAPKAIVFCGTIEHAIVTRNKINSRGFCKAAAIFSGNSGGQTMSQYARNLVLADFESGDINVICAVDVLNEGIDVPDVNLIVFNRVTHSRRIFIQQLGRGLRVAPGKHRAVILDFAQDIRRIAAGIKLKDGLAASTIGQEVTIGNRVVFRNAAGEDAAAEAFLRKWLTDVESIEGAGDDEVGTFAAPPSLS